MSKGQNTIFICQSCGYQSRKWLGKCPECGEWNSLVEERVVTAKKGGNRHGFRLQEAKAVAYTEIESQHDVRVSSGVTEFDRVLGGGIVPGTLVLLGAGIDFANSRSRRAILDAGEDARRPDFSHRSCYQRRIDCRPARSGTHRRHGSVFRRRAPSQSSHRTRDQKSFWRGE